MDSEVLGVQKKLRARLITVMTERGFTYTTLAKHMDVSPKCVYDWLLGYKNLTLKTLIRLEKALGITIINV